MQGLAVLGLIIVAIVIYCAGTLLISMIANFISDGHYEIFMFLAWLCGCILFVTVVLFWATEPFPIPIK